MDDQIKILLFEPAVGKFATILIGAIVIWIVIKLIGRKVISKLKYSGNHYKTNKFSTFVGYILTLTLIIIVFSNKPGGLTVVLGVAGAGIAFALQEVIASFAGWLAIIYSRFYKTGERVQFLGRKGDGMDFGVLRATVMKIGE